MTQHINQIWQDLHGNLEGFVMKRVKDPELARDIIQEVFLKVNARVHTLRENDKLISWIYQITRNLIVDHFRSNKKSGKTTMGLGEFDDLPGEEGHDTREMQEFAKCVLPMIEYLPPKYKEALTLSDFKGYSQKDLAEKLNISYSGAKSRVQRGREKLKELFLQCCEIETDKYGNILSYQKRSC